MNARFSHLAGDVVLDLLNTVDWRLDERQRTEFLNSPADALEWCLESGFCTAKEHDRAADRVVRGGAPPLDAELRSVREDAYAVLLENAPAARARIEARYRAALRDATLRFDGHSWDWADDAPLADVVVHRIVRALVDLLRSERIEQLHQCEDRACGWVFLDTSPRRNRRWCAAKDCGDRNRARAHYAKKRAGAQS